MVLCKSYFGCLIWVKNLTLKSFQPGLLVVFRQNYHWKCRGQKKKKKKKRKSDCTNKLLNNIDLKLQNFIIL